MKQVILCAAVLAVTHLVYARTGTDHFTYNHSEKAVGDTSSEKFPTVEDLFSDIIVVMGLSNDFKLEQADVLNLEASVSRKKKYIKYNPSFINWITESTHGKWATIALLAHEIGHHINGHTRHKTGSRPNLELEADEYAGLVLRKLGATLEEAQEVMFYIARTIPSKTHPDRKSRMLAIEKGWNSFSDSHTQSALSSR